MLLLLSALIDLQIVLGMSIDEIRYAVSITKPVVAVKITESTSSSIKDLAIEVIPYRKDSLEAWIARNTSNH